MDEDFRDNDISKRIDREQLGEMGAMGVDGNGWELWEPTGRLGEWE